MKVRYDKHTWPEIKAADKDRVVILPVGATEDHGPHIKAPIAEHRKSPMGGIAHGGEMEASMYLHFDPDHIYLDRAERQIVHSEDSRFFSLDLADGGKAMLMRWWSAQTPDGTMGDPTIAEASRGKIFYDAAVRETASLVREIRHLPILPRTDHH